MCRCRTQLIIDEFNQVSEHVRRRAQKYRLHKFVWIGVKCVDSDLRRKKNAVCATNYSGASYVLCMNYAMRSIYCVKTWAENEQEEKTDICRPIAMCYMHRREVRKKRYGKMQPYTDEPIMQWGKILITRQKYTIDLVVSLIEILMQINSVIEILIAYCTVHTSFIIFHA